MKNALENYVGLQYAYAKKTNCHDTINAYFHNAFGATCFAMDIAETQEEYYALEKFWEGWREKFNNLLWNIPLDKTALA